MSCFFARSIVLHFNIITYKITKRAYREIEGEREMEAWRAKSPNKPLKFLSYFKSRQSLGVKKRTFVSQFNGISWIAPSKSLRRLIKNLEHEAMYKAGEEVACPTRAPPTMITEHDSPGLLRASSRKYRIVIPKSYHWNFNFVYHANDTRVFRFVRVVCWMPFLVGYFLTRSRVCIRTLQLFVKILHPASANCTADEDFIRLTILCHRQRDTHRKKILTDRSVIL